MDITLAKSLTSVAELYSHVEELLVNLHGTSPDPSKLAHDSLKLKSELMPTVHSLQEMPDTQRAQSLTLASLQQGMLAGALDGANLYRHHRLAPQPDFSSEDPQLKKFGTTLKENLDRVLLVAQTSWGNSHVDDLQLLSGYGKHQNLQTLEECAELLRGPSQLTDLQNFLMATFKGGYAMGMADAAVMFVGGERPGEPPKQAK